MSKADGPRGVVHIHTAFSSDGRLAPADIAALCRKKGLSFAAISDHAEDMDEADMHRLVRECEEQSRNGILLIPGLEHRFRGGVHILALGQDRVVRGESGLDTLRILANCGCALIAAHCRPDDYLPDSLLEKLTAVEIWNVSRHTRYLPASGCMAAYRRWARKHQTLYAIGGLDMHTGCEFGCEVRLELACEMTAEAVLAEIENGRFSTQGRFASFDSRPLKGLGELAFAAGDVLVGVRDMRNRVMCRD